MKKLILLPIILILGSCDNMLDILPQDSLSPEQYYNTGAEVERAVNGIYHALVLQGGTDQLLATECMTDNMTYSSTSGSDYLAFTRGTLNASNPVVENKWKDRYIGIGRANMTLYNILTRDIEMNIDDKKRCLGESYFLRAYFYADLLDFFGGVPLANEPFTDLADANLSRATSEETLAFIVDDLDSAYNKLPYSYDNEAQLGKATKGAALFLKGKVLLYNQHYDEAAEVFEVLLESGDFSYSLFDGEFTDVFSSDNQDNNEVIFDIQYSDPANTSASYSILTPVGFWAGGYVPLVSLAEEYYSTRGMPVSPSSGTSSPTRFFENRDKRFKATLVTPGDEFIGGNYLPIGAHKKNWNSCMKVKKYVHFDDQYNPDRRSTTNVILFRYADALLMYAEALLESENLYNDGVIKSKIITQLIDPLRTRAGLPIITDIENPDRDRLREILRHERRCEFAFEGLRLSDLRRWDILTEVLDGSQATGYDPELYEGGGGYASYLIEDRIFPEHMKLWPIPQTEIDSNPKMINSQNLGY